MTAFPSQQPASIDGLVSAQRSVTPAAAVEKRTKPRLSIAELNQMDLDEVKDRFLNSKYDARTPVQQVLDIVDLPRNAIGNIIFQSAAKKQAQAGDFGALGLPRVNVSDALQDMGVENRVVRGVAGFVGDVAIDPLTYVGPAGWGVKAGKVALRGGGKKVLQRSISEAAERGVSGVADRTAADLLRAAGVTDEIRDAAEISKRVYGDFSTSKTERAFAPLGGERTATGGVFERLGTKAKVAENAPEHEAIDAVQRFIGQYGRGTGGGIKIGSGGSEIAHIPFTDISLQVPAFTAEGRATVRQFQIAKDRSVAELSENVSNAGAILSAARQSYENMVSGAIPADAAIEELRTLKDSMAARLAANMDDPIIGRPMTANDALAYKEKLDEIEAIRRMTFAQSRQSAASPEEASEALSEIASATMDYKNIIGGTLASHLTPQNKDALETIKFALGVSDDAVAMSTIGRMRSATNNIAPTGSNPLARTMEGIDRRYRAVFGSRQGEQAAEIAKIRAKYGKGAEQIGSQVAAQHLAAVKKAMQDAGLPLHDGTVDDVWALVTAKWSQLDNPNAPIALRIPDANGDLVPADGIAKLNNLLSSISTKIPDQGKRAKFIADIDQSVKGLMSWVNNLGDEEMKLYMLDQLIPDGYVPHILTPEAKAAKEITSDPRSWRSADAPAQGKQAFQRPRTTAIHVFPDIRPGREGKYEYFFEGDRWVLDSSEEAIAQLARDNPSKAQFAAEMRERIARYESLAEKPQPKQVDIFTLNRFAADGRYAPFAMEPTSKLFEDRFPLIVANRMAMHERAVATQQLVELMSRTSLGIDAKEFENLAAKVVTGGPKTLRLPSGESVSMYEASSRTGVRMPILAARGRTYRMLSPDLKRMDNNPVAKMLIDGLGNMVVPEEIADAAEDIAKIYRDDNAMTMFRYIDKATSIFRSTTLLHPSWFVNDLIGTITQLARGDFNLASWVKHLPDAAKIRRMRNNPEQLEKIVVNVGGQQLTGTQIVRMMDENRVFESHQASEILAQMYHAGDELTPSRVREMSLKQGLTEDVKWKYDRALESMGRHGKPVAGTLAVGSTAWDRINRYLFTPWAKANGAMNDSLRLAAVMSQLDSGNDVAGAVQKVRSTLYDFQDLTHIEQRYMRTLFPFYSWMRNNLSYQIRMFFQNPAYMATYPKLQTALEESLSGEQAVPMAMRPAWMRQALATQIGNDPSGRMAVLLGQSIPVLDATNILQAATGAQGAMEAGRYLLSSTNPVISAPAQLAAGTEFFSGRTISGDGAGADMSAAEFAGGLVRPLAEFGPGGRVARTIEQQGVGPAISRSILGGRVQAFDDERIRTTKARELRDRAEGLRRAIARNERRSRSSVQQRADLLAVYQEAMRLGLEQDVQVPKWAQEQIGAFAQESP